MVPTGFILTRMSVSFALKLFASLKIPSHDQIRPNYYIKHTDPILFMEITDSAMVA